MVVLFVPSAAFWHSSPVLLGCGHLEPVGQSDGIDAI